MSTGQAGTSSQRPSLPAKAPSRSAAGSLRPNPNPLRPHKPAGQNANPDGPHGSQLASSLSDVVGAMDTSTSGTPHTHKPSTTEQSSFVAAVLGSTPSIHKEQTPAAPTNNRKIPFPTRPTRSADNTLTTFGCNTSKENSRFTTAAPLNDRPDPPVKTAETEVVADCHVWTGNHNEDKLSEQVVKLGYTEKQRISNEGNTARPTMCAHLGKGSGLQALSTLFMSILQQRKEAGLVTSQTSFKPPPRVTLTDSKREAWLRDLADENFPLRRLSRTIPHGVRGKTLLAQCQTKNVPLPRAVWLVRCVGANELRAFRRKGVSTANAAGNEIKWLKEWTMTLTSFIEDSISPSPTPDARQRIFYATRLVTQLFTEKLLDQQHFLNWLLSFFEDSSMERLPISCLLVHIFWQHLACDFATSQRLAKVCATRLSTLSLIHQKVALAPLKKRLEQMVKSLFISAPATLMFNASWASVKPILVAMATNNAKSGLAEKLQETIERNDRIARLAPDDDSVPVDCHLALITLLDTYDFSDPIDAFLVKCIETVRNVPEVVMLAFRYASSVCRTGSCRILLSAALIRKTVASGVDLMPLVLNTLITLRNDPHYSAEKMSLLLADLSSTRHFDVGRYLRWIMTNGILNGVSQNTIFADFAARYVQDMSTYDLPENARNLRRMLLKAIQSYEDEFSSVAAAQAYISARLPGIFRHPSKEEAARDSDLEAFVEKTSLTTCHSLSAWLVTKIKDRIAHPATPLSSQSPAECPITSDEFMLARAVLEASHSASDVLNVLQSLLPVSDMDLLTNVLDTLYAWRHAAKLFGKFDFLMQAILARYRVLRTQGPPVRDTVVSLMRLVSSDSKYARIKKALQPEAEICSQNAGAVACTPASESMLDTSDAAGSLEHEIDRLVSNSATLDAHSVGQVFELLMSHTKLDRKHVLAVVTNSGPLLAHLSECAPAVFAKAVMAWLKDISKLATDDELYALIVSLVGSGTFSLQCALESVKESPSNVRVLLERPFVNKSLASGREQYCYTSEVRDLFETEPIQLLNVLLYTHQTAVSQGVQLDNVATRALSAAAIKDTEATAALLRQHSQESTDAFHGILCKMLDPSGQLAPASMKTSTAVQFLFKNVDQTTLPLHQVALRLFSSNDESFMKEVEAAVLTAISSGSSCWSGLVGAAGSGIANTIRRQAEEKLFKTKPDLQSIEEEGTAPTEFGARIQQELDVVGATAYSIREDTASSSAVKVVSQLGIVARYIATASSPDPSARPSRELAIWIEALLRLALVHRRSFDASKGTQDLQKLLHASGIIMSASSALVENRMRAFAYEVAAFFIAGLNPSTIMHLRPSLDAHFAHDTVARFLFGNGEARHGWLHLVTSVRPSTGFAVLQQQPPPPQAVMQQSAPFVLKPFELLPDSTPHVGGNDTALSLRLFGARRVPPRGN